MQSPQPGSDSTQAVGVAARPTALVDQYWVGMAAALRRFSLLLSEAWYDGIYLTAWMRAALWAPIAALLVGLIEGIFHVSFAFELDLGSSSLTFGLPSFHPLIALQTGFLGLRFDVVHGQAVAFTELLPLMVLVAVAGALSANLGTVMVLGYALGDFFIAGPQISYVPGGDPTNLVQSFLYLRVPQLISYGLFALLAITPTLTAKYLSAPIQRLQGSPELLWGLRGAAMALLQGALVYSWTQAAPLLVRIFWGWINSSPPLDAIHSLQEDGGWLIYPALLAAGLRAYLSYRAYQQPAVKQRVTRLAGALVAADTRQAVTRRLPTWARVALTAGALTLLLSGYIGGLPEAAIILVFLALILFARAVLLPRWSLWASWARLVTRVPVVIRLIVVFLAGNVIGNSIVGLWEQPPDWLAQLLQQYAQVNRSSSATFLPVLLSTCLGLLVAVLLLPSVEETGDTQGTATTGTTAAQPA